MLYFNPLFLLLLSFHRVVYLIVHIILWWCCSVTTGEEEAGTLQNWKQLFPEAKAVLSSLQCKLKNSRRINNVLFSQNNINCCSYIYLCVNCVCVFLLFVYFHHRHHPFIQLFNLLRNTNVCMYLVLCFNAKIL